MQAKTRGERNNNPGNIERIAANKWQGRLSDAEYRTTRESRDNAGRFEVFSAVEWGIRALAALLIAYQDRHGLRTIRGLMGRWAPGQENDTAAYVDHVARLTGFGADSLLDLHSYEHLAPLVRAVITHENGRNAYANATIDDGLFRAGVKPPGKAVVNRTADRAKTTVAVAAGGTAVISAAVTELQQIAPAVPILRDLAGLPVIALAAVGVIAAAGLLIWLATRRR